MQIREIKENEKDKWDEFIINSPNSHIFQSYGWGEVMHLLGWEPIRLVLEEGNEIKAVVNILKKRIMLTSLSVQYCPRGPVFASVNEETIKEVLINLKDISRLHHVIELKISPDINFDSSFKQVFINEQFQHSSRYALHRYTFRINLKKSVDELLAGMEKRTRNAIRKAEKKELRLNSQNREEEFNIFYNLHRQTGSRQKFNIPPFQLIKSVWQILASKKQAYIFIMEYNNVPVSGAFILSFGGKCWYLWGASNQLYPEANPSELLQWEIIKWAKSQGYLVYDLFGCDNINETDKKISGVTLFKRGFGGEFTELIGEYDYIPSPILDWGWRCFSPIYQKIRRLLVRL
ncbi:MAG: peptidoglycan bridge formation glycyltransferase FemA/FemB family protein [Planctomycetota bacterium]